MTTLSEPTIDPTWNRERCLDHLAGLDQKIRTLHDRAEWLRHMADQADTAAVLTLDQYEHFLAMIAEPSKVLDTRPGSLQED